MRKMVRMHGEQPKKQKVVNMVRMKDVSMGEGVGTEQIVTMYDDTVRMYDRKKIMEFEESGSYETLNEVNMVRMNMGSGVSLVNMEDDKHSKNVERKLVTSGRKCVENQVTKSDEVNHLPRVEKSSKVKDFQVKGRIYFVTSTFSCI